jgi:hypothetical protein
MLMGMPEKRMHLHLNDKTPAATRLYHLGTKLAKKSRVSI